MNDRSLNDKRCRNCRRPAGPFINPPSEPFDRHSAVDRHRAMHPSLHVDPVTGLCDTCADFFRSLGGRAVEWPLSQNFACIEYGCERCGGRKPFEEHLRHCEPTEYLVPTQPQSNPLFTTMREGPSSPFSFQAVKTESFPGVPVQSPTPRTPLTRAVREWIFSRDGHQCQMCGANGRNLGVQLVIDHKKPLKRGGTNHPSNLQTLCSKCNSKKGAKNTGYGDVAGDSHDDWK